MLTPSPHSLSSRALEGELSASRTANSATSTHFPVRFMAAASGGRSQQPAVGGHSSEQWEVGSTTEGLGVGGAEMMVKQGMGRPQVPAAVHGMLCAGTLPPRWEGVGQLPWPVSHRRLRMAAMVCRASVPASLAV